MRCVLVVSAAPTAAAPVGLAHAHTASVLHATGALAAAAAAPPCQLAALAPGWSPATSFAQRAGGAVGHRIASGVARSSSRTAAAAGASTQDIRRRGRANSGRPNSRRPVSTSAPLRRARTRSAAVAPQALLLSAAAATVTAAKAAASAAAALAGGAASLGVGPSVGAVAAGGFALGRAGRALYRWRAGSSTTSSGGRMDRTRAHDMSVVTYNVRGVMDRWEERLPLLRDTLARLDADVYCFQEVLTGE
jgi:hypothetical protein